MILGFTGTRNGMTDEQKHAITNFFENFLPKTLQPQFKEDEEITEVHHGGCDGSDDEFDLIANDYIKIIVVHPGDETQEAKYKHRHTFMTLRRCLPVKPYLERNKDIVSSSDVLLATPKTQEEEQRSGTWATIRYALKTQKPVYIIYPNGIMVRFIDNKYTLNKFLGDENGNKVM